MHAPIDIEYLRAEFEDASVSGYPRAVTTRALAAYAAAHRARGMEPSSLLCGPRHIGSKHELRDLLRDCGIPKSAAERVAAAGWPALSPQNQAADALERIRAATQSIQE